MRSCSAPRADSASASASAEASTEGDADGGRVAQASTQTGTRAGVGHTTHFVVADREGNVVSSTQTLGNVFGSKLMPEGTGLWLIDQLAWSRFEPQGTVFDVYTHETMPQRYHFSHNDRIAPIYVVPKVGYVLTDHVENGAGMSKGVSHSLSLPRLRITDPIRSL